MFKGAEGPDSGRTPRKRAEEIGTDPEGFVAVPDYFPQGGHPTGPGMPPAQPHVEEQVPPTEGGGKDFDPKPFAVK